MKKLIFVFGAISLLTSCKSFEEQVRARGNYVDVKPDGYVVEYIGYNPQDSLIERYPVSETDSIRIIQDVDTKKLLYYIVEDTRYVVLNENYELLRIESK